VVGSPLVKEEKYQEKPVRREEIIIMVIIAFTLAHATFLQKSRIYYFC
jgi:hypothetical protein